MISQLLCKKVSFCQVMDANCVFIQRETRHSICKVPQQLCYSTFTYICHPLDCFLAETLEYPLNIFCAVTTPKNYGSFIIASTLVSFCFLEEHCFLRSKFVERLLLIACSFPKQFVKVHSSTDQETDVFIAFIFVMFLNTFSRQAEVPSRIEKWPRVCNLAHFH